MFTISSKVDGLLKPDIDRTIWAQERLTHCEQSLQPQEEIKIKIGETGNELLYRTSRKYLTEINKEDCTSNTPHLITVTTVQEESYTVDDGELVLSFGLPYLSVTFEN